MKSKITGGETDKIFTLTVLNKYDVNYFRCNETGFIQTEEPFWLQEAYSSAITKLDIGLASRNEYLRDLIIPILDRFMDKGGVFLDYAGGYGLFTRLMRDKGFNFYHTDPYCKNLFAEFFDLENLPKGQKFELLTAFEVFEHLSDPVAELQKMSKLSDNIFFTTVLVPTQKITSVNDWWYFIPETGQHIALYTEKALSVLGSKYGFNYYTDGFSNHFYTRKILPSNPFLKTKEPILIRKLRKILKKFDQKQYPNRQSLLSADFEMIKKRLTGEI